MKRWLLPAGVVALIVGGFVIYWFEPHKLVVDDAVDEAAPVAVTQPSAAPDAPATTAPSPELVGQFRDLEHPAAGTARVVNTGNGQRVLRFENFEVSNGPDLFVYLSNAPSDSTSWTVWGNDFVNLGELKGNVGSQNYEIPSEVDLSKYSNAVVWCRRFSVGFAVAPLAAA